MFGNLPTLNQITNCLEYMKRDESISKKFDLESEEGYNRAWEGLKNYENFKTVQRLFINKHKMQLNPLLVNIGFKLK